MTSTRGSLLLTVGLSVGIWVFFALATPNHPPRAGETLAIVLAATGIVALGRMLVRRLNRRPKNHEHKP